MQISKGPLIPQRADPWVLRHLDGYYYFTASAPEYDRIVLRRSWTVAGLAGAGEAVIWRKHASGPMSWHIWAPELHFVDGAWHIYFAAGQAEAHWDIRIYVLRNKSADPFVGAWEELGQVRTDWDSFSLDATTFEVAGRRYLSWAQSDPALGPGTSVYVAQMGSPTALASRQVRITQPTLPWEIIGYRVNEGPGVLQRDGKLFVTFSASATDQNYCIGLLRADASADLLNPASWVKTQHPVLATDAARGIYGPGHNSFTVSEDGRTDLLVFHARSYSGTFPDPLRDPNRDAYVRPIVWVDGVPTFSA
jgi:GH43 family beta-xylosidase